MKITAALNKMFLKVLTGVDYISQIALETGKSVPVIFRQLDALSKRNLVKKARTGKKVTYTVQWPTVAEAVAATLTIDAMRLHKALSNKDKSSLSAQAKEFFTLPASQDALKRFASSLQDSAAKLDEFAEVSFDRTIDLFLDALGKLTPKERIKMFGEKSARFQTFLDACKSRYQQKQQYDPRNTLAL